MGRREILIERLSRCSSVRVFVKWGWDDASHFEQVLWPGGDRIGLGLDLFLASHGR